MASTQIKVINKSQIDIEQLIMNVNVEGIEFLGLSTLEAIPIWTERNIKRGETRVFPCEWVWYKFQCQLKQGGPWGSVHKSGTARPIPVYGDSTVTLTWGEEESGGMQATEERTKAAPPVNSALHMNQKLMPNQELVSQNGQFSLIYQTDGNLVLLKNRSTVLWHAGTYDTSAGYTIMQTDGNFVVYDASGRPVWASSFNGGSWGPGPEFLNSRLVVQDDGNMVVYTPTDAVLWQTNTRG